MRSEAQGAQLPGRRRVKAEQEAVYREAYTKIWRYAKTLGAASPHDVAQEVFAKLVRKWDTLDKTRPLLPWLYNAARDVVTDEHRGSRVSLVEPAHFAGDIDEVNLGPEERALSGERSRVVWAAISQLKPRTQRMLVLRFFFDMSPKQIAEQLGTSVGAVRAAIRRAYPQLAHHLQDTLKTIFPLGALAAVVSRLFRHPSTPAGVSASAASAVALAVGVGALFLGDDGDAAGSQASSPQVPVLEASNSPEAEPTRIQSRRERGRAQPGSTKTRPPATAPREPAPVRDDGGISLPVRRSVAVDPDPGPGTKESDEFEVDTPLSPARAGGGVSTSGSIDDDPCLDGVDDCAYSVLEPTGN